ncbi:MAG: hypothetical protein HOQ29_06185 [Acidobacteria bacterium]|nr:hypothetical protein [Acidobacteriota bacterium]
MPIQRRIGARDEHVERPLAVGERLELEAVIVVADRHASLPRGLAGAVQLVAQLLVERRIALPLVGHQVADDGVLDAVALRVVERAIERRTVFRLHGLRPRRPVARDDRRLDVHARALQPMRLRERRDPRRIPAEQLDLLVANRRDRRQRRIRIARPELVADGVELHAERTLRLSEQRVARRRANRPHRGKLKPRPPRHRHRE